MNLLQNTIITNGPNSNIIAKLKEISKLEKIEGIECYVGYASWSGINEILFSLLDSNANSKFKFSINYSELLSTNKKDYNGSQEYIRKFPYDVFKQIITWNSSKFIDLLNKNKISFNKIYWRKTSNDKINFHSKIYSIITNKHAYQVIGSANLTNKGINSQFPDTEKFWWNETCVFLNQFESKTLFNEVNKLILNIKLEWGLEKDDEITQSWFQAHVYENYNELIGEIADEYNSNNISSDIDSFLNTSGWKEALEIYQCQTVRHILFILDTCGGAILNYDVGLGKTLIGLCVADYYARNVMNQNIIITTPKSIAQDWKNYVSSESNEIIKIDKDGSELSLIKILQKYSKNDSRNTLQKCRLSEKQILYYGEFLKSSIVPELLVIDEAHNFRNKNTKKRLELLQKLHFYDSDVKNADGTLTMIDSKQFVFDNAYGSEMILNKNNKLVKKSPKVLLITATPVSNQLYDTIRLLDIMPEIKKEYQHLESHQQIYDKRINILKEFGVDKCSSSKHDFNFVQLVDLVFNRLNKEKFRYNSTNLADNENCNFPSRENINDQNVFILDDPEKLFKNNEIKIINSEIDAIQKCIDDLTTDTFPQLSLISEKSTPLTKWNWLLTMSSSLEALKHSMFSKLLEFSNFGAKIDLTSQFMSDFQDFIKNHSKNKDGDQAEDDEFNSDSEVDLINEEKCNNDNFYENYNINNSTTMTNNREFTDTFKTTILENIDTVNRKYNKLLETIDTAKDNNNYKYKYLIKILDKPCLKNRKKIIFCIRKATANILFDRLRKTGKNVILIQGDCIKINNDNFPCNTELKNVAKFLFAPISNAGFLNKIKNDKSYQSYKDIYSKYEAIKFEILVATDIMGEGHNLQDATVLVNYDLHWNPTKMLQRIGRIDRYRNRSRFLDIEIYNKIYVYNIFYAKEDNIVNMYPRLCEKLENHDKFNSVSLLELKNDEDPYFSKKYIDDKENKINKGIDKKNDLLKDYANVQATILTASGKPSTETKNVSLENIFECKVNIISSNSVNYMGIGLVIDCWDKITNTKSKLYCYFDTHDKVPQIYQTYNNLLKKIRDFCVNDYKFHPNFDFDNQNQKLTKQYENKILTNIDKTNINNLFKQINDFFAEKDKKIKVEKYTNLIYLIGAKHE